MPNVSWSVQDFCAKYSELDKLGDIIVEIKEKLILFKSLQEAMTKSEQPAPFLGELGLLGTLYSYSEQEDLEAGEDQLLERSTEIGQSEITEEKI